MLLASGRRGVPAKGAELVKSRVYPGRRGLTGCQIMSPGVHAATMQAGRLAGSRSQVGISESCGVSSCDLSHFRVDMTAADLLCHHGPRRHQQRARRRGPGAGVQSVVVTSERGEAGA